MIQRDGKSVSLWQSSVAPYKSKNKASDKNIYDVAVVGGGITGISLALLLQDAGKKCILFEARNLCFGTTGGTTAHLNTWLDTSYTQLIKNFGKEKARLVAQVTREAIELVKNNIQLYNIDCGFKETSGFIFSQNKEQSHELNSIHSACRDVGIKTQFRNNLTMPLSHEKVLEIPGQAKFNPAEYVHGLAHAYERAGGVILQQCAVRDLRPSEPITLETDAGEYQSKFVVYATHIPPGVNVLDMECVPYRSYALAVRLKDEMYPEGLAYDMYDPYHYYRTQEVKGKKYLIVGGEDHKTGQEHNTEIHFLHLESHVRKYFNVEDISCQWSSQYFESVDGVPYIGRLPSVLSSNIFVATGYGGNGITYSSVAAMVLKNLIMYEESRYEDLFDPSRIKAAGFKEFMKHNTDVIGQFIGKWFATEKLEEVVDLAPGEGQVVEFEGHTIALSRDSNGILHAVNPTCTHMKCSVHWNHAEQSWDCPCHGARYSPDGKVLNGPAVKALEFVELKSLVENK